MGEAKRRKATDPNYGRPRSNSDARVDLSNSEKGLVVSPPIGINGDSVSIKRSNLDRQELRLGLLFWDKLVWPQSRLLKLSLNPDEQFLERAQILSVQDFTPPGGLSGALHVLMPKVHAAAFQELDQNEPGKWSLAQGENSLWLRDGFLEAGSGHSLELYRAIPVPDRDVPLAEILEFKRRRAAELERLRAKLDEFLSSIEAADDKAAALAANLEEIDKACSDAIRVSHEWQFPVRLSNFKAQFEVRPFVSIGTFMSAWAAGQVSHLSATTALLGAFGTAAVASGSFLKLTADPGWRGLRPRPGPFRYVANYHEEVF